MNSALLMFQFHHRQYIIIFAKYLYCIIYGLTIINYTDCRLLRRYDGLLYIEGWREVRIHCNYHLD